MSKTPTSPVNANTRQTAVAVIWIDWYPYHVARFMGLQSAPGLAGGVVGIELVGGIGVHAGLKFREELPNDLPVLTLMPDADWQRAGQLRLSLKLWKTLNEVNPQIVLVPGYYTLPAIAAALWAKLRRRQSVLMTESTASDHLRVWWKEKLKALLIRTLFDWAIAGGTAHRRYLEYLGFPMDRVMRFYDVVDNGYFRTKSSELRKQSPSEFGLPSGYFLYIGRLSAEKNIDGLLAEWIRYREAGGTWPLVIVGNGPASHSGTPEAPHRYLRLRPIFTSPVTKASASSRHSMHLRGVSCSRAHANPGVLWSTKPWLPDFRSSSQTAAAAPKTW